MTFSRWLFPLLGTLAACSSSSSPSNPPDAAADSASTEDASGDASIDATPDVAPHDSGAADVGCMTADACSCGEGCCPGTVGGDFGVPCTYGCNCAPMTGFGGNLCISGICGSVYGGPCGMQAGYPWGIPCAQGTCMGSQFGLICQ